MINSCQCDLCGKIFPFNDDKTISSISFYKRDLKSILLESYSGELEVNYDLCPDCLSEIDNVITRIRRTNIK